jgi:hypothetical protein
VKGASVHVMYKLTNQFLLKIELDIGTILLTGPTIPFLVKVMMSILNPDGIWFSI